MPVKRKLSIDPAVLARIVAAGGKALYGADGETVLGIHIPPKTVLRQSDYKHIKAVEAQGDDDFVAEGGQVFRAPNPGRLLVDQAFFFPASMVSSGLAEKVLRYRAYFLPEERIAALRKHNELKAVADELLRRLHPMPSLLLPDAELLREFSDPFWHDLVSAERLALAYAATIKVERDQKRQAGAILGAVKGGIAKQKAAAAWHIQARRLGEELAKKGIPQRNIASIIAMRVGKSARAVRDVLKKEEKA